jgi:hypothetical protein
MKNASVKIAAWIAFHPVSFALIFTLGTGCIVETIAIERHYLLEKDHWFCLAKLHGECVTWAHTKLLAPQMPEPPSFELQQRNLPINPAVRKVPQV